MSVPSAKEGIIGYMRTWVTACACALQTYINVKKQEKLHRSKYFLFNSFLLYSNLSLGSPSRACLCFLNFFYPKMRVVCINMNFSKG